MNGQSAIKRILLLLAALAGVLPAAPARGAVGWFNDNWQYRREVQVAKFQPTGLAGDDIAYFIMPTAGLTRFDGGDIRMATPSANEVPCRVLCTGPGDRAVVAFALQGGLTRYYVYLGNAKPSPAAGQLEIRRGVLLETWLYEGGPIRTFDEVRRIVSNAKRLIGGGFRDRIFLGHNPFGPEDRLASRFTAHFIAPKDGTYTFASSSRDASFLLVNDKVVVDNGGMHQPQMDVRKQGKADLKQGLNKLTFYHVNTKGPPVAVAAWGLPGEDRIVPMPPSAFAPAVEAQAGPLEQYSRELTIDFLPKFAGEAYLKDRYFQRYVFEALPKGNAASGMQWQWDFGDGQKSTDARVEHVYLLDGEHTVTLSGRGPAGQFKRTNRIVVARPWDQVTQNKLDPLKVHVDIVAKYDFAALSPAACAEAMVLLERSGNPDDQIRAGMAFLEHRSAPAQTVRAVMPLLTAAFKKRREPDRAVDALLKATRLTSDPAACAELMLEAGRTCLEVGGKAELQRALDIFEQTVRRYELTAAAGAARAARIGIGDVWRARGDYDKAYKAYEQAKVGPAGAAGKAAFIRGDFARHVEDYLRKAEHQFAGEYLQTWEETYPLDKLDGYWSLLKVRLLLAEKRFGQAAREAEILVAVNVQSNYGAELLMLAAEAYKAMNKPDKARAAMLQIVEKFPESPLAEQAAKLAGDGGAGAASRPAGG